MTGSPVGWDRSASPDTSGSEQSAVKPQRWRGVVGAVAWLLLFGCVIALCLLFMRLFAMSLGSALHAEISVDEQVPLFWGLAAVCGVIALVLVCAVIGQRWVALVLALVVGCVGGMATIMVFNNVRSVIAPVVHVEPEPIHCQCYSGSPCDCPGG